MSEMFTPTIGSGFEDSNGPVVNQSAMVNGSLREGPGVKGWDSLYQELEALGAEIARLSVDSLAAGQERLAADVKLVQRNIAALLRQAQERGASLNENAVAFARSYPITTSLIAFGAGAVVTKLLWHRR